MKASDRTEQDIADDKERSTELGEQLDHFEEEVAPKKPAVDHSWKGDVA
jgi:hypothetical protein